MQILRRIWAGLQDGPVCGPHPGTFWLIAFIGMGALAGGGDGWWFGALIMAIIFVPRIYLVLMSAVF